MSNPFPEYIWNKHFTQIMVQIKENLYKVAMMVPIPNCENKEGNGKYVWSRLTDFCTYFLLIIFHEIFQ
jgi:hypothetical protein